MPAGSAAVRWGILRDLRDNRELSFIRGVNRVLGIGLTVFFTAVAGLIGAIGPFGSQAAARFVGEPSVCGIGL